MSLDRFKWEQKTHRATGLSQIVTYSGQATGYIGDGTGVKKGMVVKWDRELRKRHDVIVGNYPTGRALTGGY